MGILRPCRSPLGCAHAQSKDPELGGAVETGADEGGIWKDWVEIKHLIA
jgi:hypothetical protein